MYTIDCENGGDDTINTGGTAGGLRDIDYVVGGSWADSINSVRRLTKPCIIVLVAA